MGGGSWAPEVNVRRSETMRRTYQRRSLLRRVGSEALRRLPSALRRADVREAWMAPFAAGMAEEVADLLAARGGAEHASEPEIALIGDLAIAGAIMRAEAVRYFRTADRESAARVASLANARRAGLLALGLKREAKAVTLAEYLEERERLQRLGSAEVIDLDGPEVAEPADRIARGEERGVGGARP